LLYGVAVNLNFSATDIKLEVSLGAAFLASILSCIASQPGDVILTNTYKNKGDGVLSFQEVVSSIRDNQGLNGFFAGISARFLHVGAIITFQLVLYDYIKQMLGLPATGTH
jgi:solute carrier family 25 phosphate transporter 3